MSEDVTLQELIAQNRLLQAENERLKQEIKLLKQKVDLLIRRLFGSKSEKLDPAQLELLLKDLDLGKAVASAEKAEATPTVEASKPIARASAKKQRRERWPQDLAIEQEVVEPAEVRDNPEAFRCIGEEVTEMLDYRPAKFFRRQIIRRKFVRRDQAELAPLIAPLPESLQQRCIAAPGLLAQVIVSKYCDHQPAVEHFGFWRAKRHPRSKSVRTSEVAEFLNSHLPRCGCPPPAATSLQTCLSALNRLMTMLGCRNPSSQSCQGEGPIKTLVADFDQHLTKVCGLSAATRFYRRRYAREFLEWRFEGKRWDLTKLCFADFVAYVKFQAPRLKPASVGVMMSSLRTLVRFLEFEGRYRSGLSQAWPTVPNWKQSPPSDVLTTKECRDLLQSVDRHCPSGQRDFAILRLMTDLGLRGAEIVELCLEDIDWRAGSLVVRKNKQRRERLLPLPPLVAKAILSYLRTGRPCSSSRRLFLCHRLPVGQPMTPERLRGAVRRIMRRSGLTDGGPHRLRHSFATRLHARGASIKEVADVLGHQHFDTATIYARVNLSQLRKVALPWPRTRL